MGLDNYAVYAQKNGKGNWFIKQFAKAMEQQKVWDKVEIYALEDGYIKIFFYSDYASHTGWYIVGSPIVAEIGSN